MSDRVRELAERQAELQERCAAQRAVVAHEAASIEARFDVVDRVVVLARNTVLNPSVIVAAATVVLVVGRLRGLGLLGRLLLLGTAARRLIVVAKKIGANT
jgi:hypothetical protein